MAEATERLRHALLHLIRAAHEQVEVLREIALLQLDDDETADYLREAAEILRGADVQLGERLKPPDLPDFMGEH